MHPLPYRVPCYTEVTKGCIENKRSITKGLKSLSIKVSVMHKKEVIGIVKRNKLIVRGVQMKMQNILMKYMFV